MYLLFGRFFHEYELANWQNNFLNNLNVYFGHEWLLFDLTSNEVLTVIVISRMGYCIVICRMIYFLISIL